MAPMERNVITKDGKDKIRMATKALPETDREKDRDDYETAVTISQAFEEVNQQHQACVKWSKSSNPVVISTR